MADASNNIFSTLVIWVFAGAIVALGLHDLYRIHGKKGGVTRVEIDAMIDKLHGEVDIKRASFNPQLAQELKNEEAKERPQDETPLSVREVFHRLFPDQVKK